VPALGLNGQQLLAERAPSAAQQAGTPFVSYDVSGTTSRANRKRAIAGRSTAHVVTSPLP
jgi:hypothetical protein